MHGRFHIQTNGPGLTEFTDQVAAWVPNASGLLTLFIRHTSASLLIQENADPEVQTDLIAWLGRAVPRTSDPSMSYLTHTYEGPDDMPGHIKSMLLPVNLSIPVIDGRMMLGTWQGIYLVEHRDRPHDRQVSAHFRADT
ncbi:secondary thiamine-phosphate synthase enzyme [Jannaschia faecimaris]|uniref:Secondary thiamine-phosphate synthase enzyme n=1 Tax=Jannaschia faecimaris TaxID=1244108 RepID=A0A1H3KZJ3_9RHOB|nr:secondary thiamine-phosphate synthase enzyme YjbQ [Jannaschia faecimaris]SDY57583.1 secondary thiamine-phosphate synthase enzyme [Jannaschia faecimaris]